MTNVNCLIAVLAVCAPLIGVAGPSNGGGPAFLEQGKVAIGIETFGNQTTEVELEDEYDSSSSELESSAYSVEFGYMIFEALQVRVGYGSTSEKYDDGDTEYTTSRIEPGVRYFFKSSPHLYPFVSFRYAMLEKDREFEPLRESGGDSTVEGTELAYGGGVLLALGGSKGGFASFSLDAVSSEEERSSSTRTFSGLKTQLVLGLYF